MFDGNTAHFVYFSVETSSQTVCLIGSFHLLRHRKRVVEAGCVESGEVKTVNLSLFAHADVSVWVEEEIKYLHFIGVLRVRDF